MEAPFGGRRTQKHPWKINRNGGNGSDFCAERLRPASQFDVGCALEERFFHFAPLAICQGLSRAYGRKGVQG